MFATLEVERRPVTRVDAVVHAFYAPESRLLPGMRALCGELYLGGERRLHVRRTPPNPCPLCLQRFGKPALLVP